MPVSYWIEQTHRPLRNRAHATGVPRGAGSGRPPLPCNEQQRTTANERSDIRMFHPHAPAERPIGQRQRQGHRDCDERKTSPNGSSQMHVISLAAGAGRRDTGLIGWTQGETLTMPRQPIRARRRALRSGALRPWTRRLEPGRRAAIAARDLCVFG